MRMTDVLVVLAGSTFAAAALAGDPADDRAYAAELKADASAKTSALAENDAFVESDSSVKLGGWMQFRYYMNFREDTPDTGLPHQSGFTNGFEATKTRLITTGNVMSKDLTFKIEGEFSKTNGNFSLLDAYVNYAYENGWSTRIGQFKLPLLRQELISDTNQLMVGRSLTNDIFSQKRSQGVMGAWRNDSVQVRGALSDGLNTLNTPYTSPKEADIALTGRVDFKGGADWKVFDDYNSWQGNETAWLFGVAANWQSMGNTNASATVPQQNQFEYTADFTLQGSGWNVFAMFVGNHISPDSGGGNDTNNFGAQIQGGFFVHKNVEIYGSWDAVFPDSSYGAGLDSNFNTLSAGANFFPFEKSEAVRFVAQFSWFVNNPSENGLVNSAASNNNVGLLPNNADNQFAIIFQAQVVF